MVVRTVRHNRRASRDQVIGLGSYDRSAQLGAGGGVHPAGHTRQRAQALVSCRLQRATIFAILLLLVVLDAI